MTQDDRKVAQWVVAQIKANSIPEDGKVDESEPSKEEIDYVTSLIAMKSSATPPAFDHLWGLERRFTASSINRLAIAFPFQFREFYTKFVVKTFKREVPGDFAYFLGMIKADEEAKDEPSDNDDALQVV